VNTKFPVRFFVITFAWTWLFFALAIFFESGAVPLPDGFAKTISLPLQIVAAFGPAAGAFVSLCSHNGKGAAGKYIKSFLSLNFGWKVWFLIVAVLGLPALASRIIPELFGENRFPPYMPVYMFPPLSRMGRQILLAVFSRF
jgi:hypothetical protein